MKILMLAQNRLDARLGGPRVVMELTEALGALGCEVRAMGPGDVAAALGLPDPRGPREVARLFDTYLLAHAQAYDVVDYDHGYLPFPRSRYAAQALFVARSVLLLLHLRHLNVPGDPSWRACAGRRLKPWKHGWARHCAMNRAESTLRQADFVNVSNARDVNLLRERYGFSEEKILHLPFGISQDVAVRLRSCKPAGEGQLDLVMIGTFDHRKGCLDLVKIFRAVRTKRPEATLTLLGAKGLFQRPEAILACFDPADRPFVKIVMSYPPDTLPGLLDGKSFGLFPSYLEGFGIGVVEMLAAGIPVIAYDAPGPESILESDALVAVGDTQGFSRKILEWAAMEEDQHLAQRAVARESTERFRWETIAAETLQAYRQKHEKHRARTANGNGF